MLTAAMCSLPCHSQDTEHFLIQGPNGKLNAVLEVPDCQDGSQCPVVVLLHGFTSNCDDPVMKKLAEKLYSRGIASLRFDFDGHGKSEGDFVDMTVMKEVADAEAAVAYLEGLHRFSSISMAGHSQGGVVASLVAGRLGNRISRLVLLAPAAVLVDDARNGRCMMSHYDPDNVPEYVDVFGHHLGRAYILEAQKLDIYYVAKSYTGPVCIVHGTDDEIVPCSYSQKYYNTYDNSEIHLLEGLNHMFSPHLYQAVDIAVDFLSNSK